MLSMQVRPGLLAQAIHGSVTGEEFTALAEQAFHHPALGDDFVVISRIAPRSVREAPGDDFRKAAAEMIKRHQPRLRGFAFVVLGSPMLGATVRAIITGITFLSRSPHPEKAFGDIDEAAQWLHDLHPEVSVADIVAAVDDLVVMWQTQAETA